MRILIYILLSFFPAIELNAQATLKLNFMNTAGGVPLVIRDSTYKNPHGEEYTIRKLRYYIGNPNAGSYKESGDYYLVDQAKNTSIEFNVQAGIYDSISFLLGVDSSRNCSGAQDGALDPMNDMFWTWNTGYVMFKLEGTSPSSKGDLNRIEHHIGGYRFGQNVATKVTIPVKRFLVKNGDSVSININMELDRYWNGINPVRISEYALCMSPGDMAKYLASNFTVLFKEADNKTD